ncbi:MAG TPA: hypothetical protein V6D08_08815 [Candidatus Obscuribacterales bacterium]
MNGRRATIVALVALLSFASAAQSAQQTEGSVLQVGSWHGDEVRAETGQLWYGLFRGKNGYELKRTRLEITLAHDPIVDEGGRQTGKKVTVSDRLEPLFLVRNIPGCKPGPVPTVFSSSQRTAGAMRLNERRRFNFGSKEYVLSVAGQGELMAKSGDTYINSYQITLTAGTTSQVLASHNDCNLGSGEGPRLLWAGDLDGDKKLDLLLDVTPHYNMMVLKLFISSRASKGALVVPVAEWTTTGC